MDDRDALIVGYVRTPFGRYGGALSLVRPDDLAALVIRAVLERSGVAEALRHGRLSCTCRAMAARARTATDPQDTPLRRLGASHL